MFKVRKFTEKDYPKYTEWLSIRQRAFPTLENLPEVGYVVFGDEDYAIGFIVDQKNTGILCNMASNSLIESEIRSKAVDFLIDYMIGICEQRKMESIFVNTNKMKLVERLKMRNFQVYDTNIIQLGRVL